MHISEAICHAKAFNFHSNNPCFMNSYSFMPIENIQHAVNYKGRWYGESSMEKKRTIKLAWKEKKIRMGTKAYTGNYLWRMYYLLILVIKLEQNISVQKVEREQPPLWLIFFSFRCSPKHLRLRIEEKRTIVFCGKNECEKVSPQTFRVATKNHWSLWTLCYQIHRLLRSSFDEIPCI